MKACLLLILVVLTVSCSRISDRVSSLQLSDESSTRGLDYTYISGGTMKYRLPEIMGGGVAMLDSDLDGDLDVYFVQSGSIDENKPEHGNALYINDGSGKFMLHDAGDASLDLGYGMGVAVGDVNGDLLPDIFVTQLGRDRLLLNRGENQFEDVTTQAGFRREDWSTAAAFIDFDMDGDLDLWVINYLDWNETIEPECYQMMLGSRDYCAPFSYDTPSDDRVYRNDGQGRFVDVSEEMGILGFDGNGLGVVTSDFNRDGWLDIFVANDTSPNRLWINQAGNGFKDEALSWNSAVDQHGVARAGMGIVATDLDDDADQDLVIVHITTEPSYVFRNEGNYFLDVTANVGLSIFSQRYTRFGLVVSDLNNDGWLDIYKANGAVTRLPIPYNGDKFAEPNSLYLGMPDGRFEMIEDTGSINTSRGAAVGDIDNNGSLEMIVVDRDQPVKLLVNQSSNQGNWLMFDVRDGLGRPALGALVSVDVGQRTITRVVQRASSYLSSRDPRVHFGLGTADKVSNIRIKWLRGVERRFEQIDVNQIITVEESAS